MVRARKGLISATGLPPFSPLFTDFSLSRRFPCFFDYPKGAMFFCKGQHEAPRGRRMRPSHVFPCFFARPSGTFFCPRGHPMRPTHVLPSKTHKKGAPGEVPKEERRHEPAHPLATRENGILAPKVMKRLCFLCVFAKCKFPGPLREGKGEDESSRKGEVRAVNCVKFSVMQLSAVQLSVKAQCRMV